MHPTKKIFTGPKENPESKSAKKNAKIHNRKGYIMFTRAAACHQFNACAAMQIFLQDLRD